MGISLTGLVSGLDTAKMVSDLVEIERIPYKNLESKKTNLRSEQTIFRNLNTAFRSLETALNNLKYASDWKKMSAISSSTDTLGISAKSNAIAGKYQVNVIQLAQKNTVQLDGAYLSSKLSGVNEFTIGEATIQTNGSIGSTKEELEQLAALINEKSQEAGATATVVKTSATGNEYKLVLTSLNTGDASETEDSEIPKSNLITFKVDGLDLAQDSVTGKVINNKTDSNTLNAIVQLDGVEVQRSTNNIDDLIQGATLNLKSMGSSTVTIARDTDAIIKNVQEFVKAYNNLIGMVKDNLAKPADDSKMNPLQGDALLKRIDSELYNIFNSGVKNSGDSQSSFMEQFGLSIDKGITKGSLMTGKITFDEAMFKNALAENPDKVIGIFTNSAPKSADTHTAGVITQLSGIINSYASSTNGLIASKITGYDAEIKFVDERMERMSMRLEMYEARLKQQFSTMETMLSTLQSEQKWLTQQFESLLKSNSK